MQHSKRGRACWVIQNNKYSLGQQTEFVMKRRRVWDSESDLPFWTNGTDNREHSWSLSRDKIARERSGKMWNTALHRVELIFFSLVCLWHAFSMHTQAHMDTDWLTAPIYKVFTSMNPDKQAYIVAYTVSPVIYCVNVCT